MKVPILFESVEGQTRKIAEFVAQEVRKAGHDVSLFDASDNLAPFVFEDAQKVILAAPVHERRHPASFEVYLGAHRRELAARQTLLLSVSLHSAFPDSVGDAQDYVTEMKMRTKFHPSDTLLVAGAVRSSSYDFYASQIIRHVVLRGHEIDPALAEHEFTDWAALASKIAGFLGSDSTLGAPA
ncbi:MAG: protoporphyrinogen oxidase [Rhodobacteraceae bacterium]|nr:protoporphyrinogen oxidase [Paracoccaceae bacterium]MCP5341534.1 protoporphyrinogen oxidase [Paracoccaceae bacterium]